MSKRLFLFALWCGLLVGMAAVSAATAWSPFANATGRHQTPGPKGGYHGGHGGVWIYGPMHK